MADELNDELKKLAPAERIKRLRAIEAQRKKELEEQTKKVEEELKATEALIAESVDEITEEKAIEDAKEKLRELQFVDDEDLEAKLAAERAAKKEEPPAVLYETQPNLYQALPQAVQELARLYGNAQWDEADRQNYQHAKEVVQKAQQYALTSEQLAEELGIGSSILTKFRYRT
jgi:hypothetical protein